MPYITRMLDGRPYQCYVPNPVYPAVAESHRREFARIDAWLARTVDAERFHAQAPLTIAQTHKRIASAEHLRHAQKAIGTALASKSFGCKQLKRAHAVLCDSTDAAFRARPGWVGAAHPSMSWHVGSPPDMLDKLMETLMEAPSTVMPASMLACIRMFRILQIHPFADGNGRVARLAALRCIHHSIGPALGFLDVLDALWDRAESDIHTVSLAAQRSEDLSPVFDHIGSLLANNIQE